MEAMRPEPDPSGAIVISCDDCAMQHSEVCEDCLVSFITGRDPDDAVVIDVDEARALRMMTKVGLVPGARHVPRESRVG